MYISGLRLTNHKMKMRSSKRRIQQGTLDDNNLKSLTTVPKSSISDFAGFHLRDDLNSASFFQYWI